MKKVLFIIAIAFASLVANAQEKPHKIYAELLGTSNLLQTKVTISIDFGQQLTFGQQHAQKQLVDAQGREMKFNSMVDAMNYMGTLGWEFEQAYVVTTSNQNVYHWLMSKVVDNDESATQGIQTRKNYIDAQSE